MAQGRMSEIFGAETLPMDKYTRTMGQTRMVEHYLTLIEDDDLLLLENYAAGINKVAEELHVWPLEFYLLWSDFEPWTPRDSVAISYILANFVTSDWAFELTRTRLLEVFPRDFVNKIFPFRKQDFSLDFPVQISQSELKTNTQDEPIDDLIYNPFEALNKQIDFQGPEEPPSAQKFGSALNGQGSNCWAVAGHHMQAGKPVLACDPHLQKNMHSIWYIARVSWLNQGASRVSGVVASVTGTPTLTHAHSQGIAWGVTAINPDVTDVFVEQVSEDGLKYLVGDGQQWAEFGVSTEVVKVRFGGEVKVEIRSTRNGVVLP
jgi:penicillin amidase